MKILVSNDDGYYAPGIKALISALCDNALISDIYVVAPDRDKSGASNSLTLDKPIRPIAFQYQDISDSHQKINQSYHIQGTPTDCVHIAATGLFENVDMVISGINAGANLGDDVIYSGTVAAATEGRHLGLPALAVSLAFNYSQSKVPEFESAARIVNDIIQYIKDVPGLDAESFKDYAMLNINIPNIPYQDIKGFKITRLGRRHKAQAAIKQKDPRGENIYWLGSVGHLADSGEGTDFHAIANNFVSITPLSIDLTHYSQHEILKNWSLLKSRVEL
ncbi:MAG: 5'/3'-nucleotidase SurE [Gammaproteobacteria bacterium]|nr:5'/3'-nucleotidase SurE [Gammaproteobacteria bacterium]